MSAYILRRCIETILVIFVVSVLIFFLVRLIPGDPVTILAGTNASEKTIARLKERLGLTDSLYIQYLKYVESLLKGDLGYSLRTKRKVSTEIAHRFFNSFMLALVSMALAIGPGFVVGVISGSTRRKWLDDIILISSTLFICIPSFWLGMMLILVFSVKLRLIPILVTGGGIGLVLPAFTLMTQPMAKITRLIRGSMLDIRKSDYIRTAEAKGLSSGMINIKHVLRNSLIPATTFIGQYFGALIGRAVIVETVFVYPGIGKLLADSIFTRDYPVIQVLTMLLAVVFVLANLLVDIIYAFLDPRIQY